MQSINQDSLKNSNQQKSIFSCNIYQTNHGARPIFPPSEKNLPPIPAHCCSKSPQFLYINKRVLGSKLSGTEDLKEISTQTSKTILELAKIDCGDMSPDSLTRSPTPRSPHSLTNGPRLLGDIIKDKTCPDSLLKSSRYSQNDDSIIDDCPDCPSSLHNHCSDYTLEGSCHAQEGLLYDKSNIQRYIQSCVPPPNSHEDVYTATRNVFKKSLTKAFLERTREKTVKTICQVDPIKMEDWENNSKNSFKSKSFIGSYCHPNYIKEPVKTKVVNVEKVIAKATRHQKGHPPIELPDNSFAIQKPSTVCYQTQNSFMLPTTSSQNKNILPEVQNLNHLIPPTRRGRSTSPKPATKHFSSCKKIPYIDQSTTNLSSSTTLLNVSRCHANFPSMKNRTIFEEDLLKMDDLSLNFKTSYESIITNVDTNSSIDSTICVSINKLRNCDWNVALKGLAEVVELCRIVDVDVIFNHMTGINQRLIELLKSPRSYVCRTACQAAGHLFEYVKDTRRPEFDDIVDLLLFKTADANKFIRQDANLSLDCMVTHISVFNSIRALCSKGPFHKNSLVRTATIRLIVCAVVIAGPDAVLNPNNSECTRKRIFINLGRFLEDKHLETRKFGEKLYKILCQEARFEIYLKKYIDKEQIIKIKKNLKLIHKKMR